MALAQRICYYMAEVGWKAGSEERAFVCRRVHLQGEASASGVRREANAVTDIPVDLVMLDGASSSLAERIGLEGVVLYEKGERLG